MTVASLVLGAVQRGVGLAEQIPDRILARGLAEELAEVLVAQVTRNVFQAAQVISGTVGRGNQQKQDVDVFAIQAREIDPRLGESRTVEGRVQSLTTTPMGVVDILIVAFLIYELILIVRGTRAARSLRRRPVER